MKKRRFLLFCCLFLGLMIQFGLVSAQTSVTVLYQQGTTITRYCVIPTVDMEFYIQQGWSQVVPTYDKATTTLLYAENGQVLFCPTEEAEAQHTVGWYNTPRYKMYAPDGRTLWVGAEEITTYEAVGWYREPIAFMNDQHGQSRWVVQSQINKYRDNGWYIQEAVQELYPLMTCVKEFLQDKDGEWGIYVKNLTTGEALLLNDQPAYSSASIIKLFVMAEVYNEIAYGSLPNDAETQELLREMITVSDNLSSNLLVKKLGAGDYERGFAAENANTRSIGCKNTQHKSLFIGYGDYVSYGKNLVAPEDCGLVLEKIYHRELVSPTYSDAMLQLLKQQQRRNKIPQPLPEGTVTANKTGETSIAENDVAIVYSPACDYILCVMSNHSNDGISAIRSISSIVYNYFNDGYTGQPNSRKHGTPFGRPQFSKLPDCTN